MVSHVENASHCSADLKRGAGPPTATTLCSQEGRGPRLAKYPLPVIQIRSLVTRVRPNESSYHPRHAIWRAEQGPAAGVDMCCEMGRCGGDMLTKYWRKVGEKGPKNDVHSQRVMIGPGQKGTGGRREASQQRLLSSCGAREVVRGLADCIRLRTSG